ncbi:MAG TPA: DUF4118 domain-containing protein [Actinomycetes bacterium]|nr:DUF4118 domain-containing protein [Actinomycetes bacterium]
MRHRFAGVAGQGVIWGVGGFAASLVLGVVLEPFRARIGLENVVIGYLAIVVVCAAVGGRGAGLVAALSAALSYDFFFTTPYRTLKIDTAEQVVTFVLLFAAGLLAALGGRSSRRGDARQQQEEDALALLNAIAKAAAEGADADRTAADGLLELLDAAVVQVRRGDRVTAEAGSATGGSLDPEAMTHLEPDGRLPHGTKLRFSSPGGFALPREGVVLPLGRQAGVLVIVPGRDRGVPRAVRAGLAGVAYTLGLAGAPAGLPGTENGGQARG